MTERIERRVVTVLFADLVGFTTLSEQLDAEDVALVQQEYFAGARKVVNEHGGHVEKFIGDAVVAAFGVSHAGDYDASSAIRAGLAIIEAVAATERALSLEPGTLRVRVGVNTGEVVVVHGSGDADDWRLAGDVVNTAARLQAAAEPGTVLVGAETAFGAAPAFVLESVGTVALKGKAASTPAWRVVRARAVPSREFALHGLHAEVVGRDRDLSMLEQTHRDVSDCGSALLVLAPPGVGKSRLVTEFCARTVARGGTVWVAKVREEKGPYGAIADLLRAALGPVLASVDAKQLLLERLGSVTPRAQLAVDHTLALVSGQRLSADPVELWTSWAAMLDADPCETAPVWVIEDVQLADADLRAFIRDAVTHAYRVGRLILLTARPGSLPPVEPFGAVPAVSLEPLDAPDRRVLVERLVGAAVVPDDVIEMISDSSRGNPLFIEELLRSWVQSGALRRSAEDQWEFDPLAGRLHVPSTVWAIYLSQLDDLPPEPRGVVESGSVPGTTFPSRALPVLGVPGADDALDFLTAFGLLAGPHDDHDLASDCYTYRHALLRDAAYAAMPRARRADLHGRFAEWLAVNGDPGQVAELVGRHFDRARAEMPALGGGSGKDELARRAAHWLELGGDHAIIGAPHHAVGLFERARDLTVPSDAARARCQLSLAEALRRSGRMGDAMSAFEKVPAGSPESIGAALGYEDALFASRMPRNRWGAAGRKLLQDALAGDVCAADEARLLAALARAEIYGGDAEQGVVTARTALSSARACGDRSATAEALLAIRASQGAPEQLAARLSGVRDLVDSAREAGDRELEVEGLRLQFVDLLETGDVLVADAVQRQAEALIARLDRPLYFWYPPMWAAMRALLAGDFAAATGLVEHFRDEGTRWHYQDVDLVYGVQLLQLHLERGHPDRALPEVTALAERLPERFAAVRAACLARLGRLDEARKQLATMVVPDDQSRSYVLSLAVEVAAALLDAQLSATLHRQLEPWAGHNVVLGSGAVCLGSASHYVGLAARGSGDLDLAVDHLRVAVRMNEDLGAAPAAARSRAELARSLSALGHTDEAARLMSRVEAGRTGLTDLVDPAITG